LRRDGRFANKGIVMKILLKSAFAAAVLLGSTATISTPANAGVTVGITLPGVYVSPYGPGYVAYDDDYYYDPIYIGGAWYHGPYRWRMRHGERMFYVNGGWHRNEWRHGPVPTTIVFRNGGSFRDGRNIGFDNAERINARFRPGNGEMHNDRQEIKSDRQELKQDKRELKDDRQDKRDDKHDDHKN
jgi:hypothetical protein